MNAAHSNLVVLDGKNRLKGIDLREIWRYRDLVLLMVQRDFVTFYKQTVLGPIWYILQPLLMTIVFQFVFGKISGLSTDGAEPFLFYLAGSICWNYFGETFTKTSNTFIQNAAVFGKVYFPRIVAPISATLSNLIQFLIQFLLFLFVYFYFYAGGMEARVSWKLVFMPLVVLQVALLALGVGLLISALTTKYRDLLFAVRFGLQIWMYASPLVYPASTVPESYRFLYMMNPMAPVLETFRWLWLGAGLVETTYIVSGVISTLAILGIGLLLFGIVEKDFVDTV